MVQLPSFAWLCRESSAKLFEREGVNGSIESISPVMSHLALELLSVKVKAKSKEPPPSRHVGVSVGPDFPALDVAAAVFVSGS